MMDNLARARESGGPGIKISRSDALAVIDMARAGRTDAIVEAMEGLIEARAAEVRAELEGGNPAEILRDIAEGMVDGVTIKGVDHASFDAAAAKLDEPGQPDAENPEASEDWFKTARLVHGLAPTAAGKVPGRQQAALLNGAIGLRVEKRSGDYDFDGEVRAVIVKRSGEVRYAVEDDRGLLLVMNARQCGLEEVARLEAPWRKDGVADLAAFRMTTGDPRFDPGKPVSINGFTYHPTKED